jgi:Fe-S oxidoreductase
MLLNEHQSTIDACRFCFMCRHVCTLGVVSGKESDTPRGKGLILFKALRGHVEYSPALVETLYRCCLCGLCETWCKAKCTPPAAVLAARADIVAQGRSPQSVQQIKDNLLKTGNPFGLPGKDRFKAIDTAGVVRDRAEVLYYVGCETAYQRPEIANAFLKILRQAKVDAAVVGDEHSTGKQLWLLGYRNEARTMAESLLRKIRSTGCRTVVTTCPSALDAFTKDYPAMGLDLSGIEFVHAAEYLDRLLADGRLKLRAAADLSVTLLDNGYLGRYHGIYDAPRRVLAKVSSAQPEMVWTREVAHSCGEAGGILRLLHPELARAMADRVLAEASSTGASVVATTCPVTKTTLLDAQTPGPKPRDLVELVADALVG